MSINFQAVLQRQKFALHEALELTLTVTNPSSENIEINDPLTVDESVRFLLKEDKVKQWAYIGSAFQEQPHGVPLVPQTISVPNQLPVYILFDLTKYFEFKRPGSYTLTIFYTWQESQEWQSPEVPFEILKPDIQSLGIIPNEASRRGYHGLYWLEREGELLRVLHKSWRVQDKKFVLKGAEVAGIVPVDSMVTLSMQPAADPMPERWLIWLTSEYLYASYFSSDDDLRLSAVGVKLPETMKLISPALAGPVPDDTRPSCAVGLLSEGRFYLVEIASSGQFQIQKPVAIAGTVKASWAVALDANNRFYYFVTSDNENTVLYRVPCRRNQACDPADVVLKIDGEFLVGDLRLSADNKIIVGILLKKDGEWTRNLFSDSLATVMDVISQDNLNVGFGMPEAIQLRIDDNEKLHLLYLKEGVLHYVKHTESTSHWLSRDVASMGNLYEMALLTEDRVKLIYYHKMHGLMLEDL